MLARLVQILKAQMSQGATFEGFLDQLNEAYDYFDERLNYNYNPDFDPRILVGDNYSDVSEKYYGNNDVKGNSTIKGNLGVTGDATFYGDNDIRGNVIISETLEAIGETTFYGNNDMKGNSTINGTLDINSGKYYVIQDGKKFWVDE
jgi:hypothetical protein